MTVASQTIPVQPLTVHQIDTMPAERFQVVAYGASVDSSPICAFPTQGEATSWLLCNGYQWIRDSNPHQWVKS